jgi:hypothetical protein
VSKEGTSTGKDSWGSIYVVMPAPKLRQKNNARKRATMAVVASIARRDEKNWLSTMYAPAMRQKENACVGRYRLVSG